ncbi:uncharacterized protein LOC126708501 [Quercus robur]|uniref:uncharacterized protein LOC126708501 n=1 Tax=Quercus robur TaxID=38942 RepID=UPI0021633410|nr:uncharacterized protein LOC126708501 [Quercus robur]
MSFKSCSNAHIDVVVREGVGAQSWRATGFYGHPDADRDARQMEVFRKCLSDCGLIDLGFVGQRFTWCNGRIGEQRTRVRLDRMVANEEWRKMFPEARVIHRAMAASDHCLLNLSLRQRIQDMLKSCQAHLQTWNRREFGNVNKNLRQKQSRLQQLEELNLLHESVEEIQTLKKEINEVLLREEMMWNQRSRALWVKCGDRNTKFFHATASNRCRKNRIEGLCDSGGMWREDCEEVEGIILTYFKEIYSSNFPVDFGASLGAVDRKVTEEMNEDLLMEFKAAEVWRALKQMHPTKSPGPDVLANRLTRVLPEVISDAQSAFVPGRQIIDNVLVAFEVMHCINKRRKGKEGLMAIKLDMSKAYDRVEWAYLEAMMRKMGFQDRWISLMMMCVTTVSYSVLLNGEPKGRIVPTRGLRQGDPISPYLFLLCTEGLSAMLKKSENGGIPRGIAMCRSAPRVSHLLFANDCIVFGKTSKEEGQRLLKILEVYEKESGQKLNREKTSLFFSKNTREEFKEDVKDMFGAQIIHQHE